MTDIVTDALRYQGAGYSFGGVPGTGIGHWDCSSFVSWVMGNDLKMAIPGYSAGAYHGQVHGPVVLDYATWSGAVTHSGAPNRGDLCVWPGVGATGHIGIATDGSHMISALNSSMGTVVTPIQGYGPAGVALIYRSVTGAATAGVSVPSGCVSSTSSTAAILYAIFCAVKWGRHLSRR